VRKILIVGAGHAGLQLALSLQADGYDITLMSARTAAEIRGGYPTSTQAMFGPALDHERAAGLNLWDGLTEAAPGCEVSVVPAAGVQALSFYSQWDQASNSVDQRVKMSTWLELFEQRGGRVIYHMAMTSELAALAGMYDLTVIAAGKGELVEMFDRDAAKSKYTSPGRHLSAMYLNGVEQRGEGKDPMIDIIMAPGAGEFYAMPAYTVTGRCNLFLLEAVPGGPWDQFTDRPSADEHLRRTRAILDGYLPWQAPRYAKAEPTDPKAMLSGAFTTTIRKPTAEVAPGSHVLGMADVVVVNDPVSGQGANNASHSAAIYGKAIRDRGDQPFDQEWMQATFDTYWAHAKNSIALTEMLLDPLPEHIVGALGAASQYPAIAKRAIDLFPYPGTIHDWLLDPAKAAAYLESVTAGA
jgi:2-polyprenyl-6-methoxyphenol hydroxylase-like FAD-dependent oxidoreductase